MKEEIVSGSGSDEPKTTIDFFLDGTFGHSLIPSVLMLQTTYPQSGPRYVAACSGAFPLPACAANGPTLDERQQKGCLSARSGSVAAAMFKVVRIRDAVA
jgi:hypothetical protein